MNDKDKIIIQKIIGYIRDAISFTEGLELEEFMRDKKTISASAFAVGQIGELVQELSDETITNNPGIQWKNIRGMRNRLIHDYENIDFAILWRTLRINLPELLILLDDIAE